MRFVPNIIAPKHRVLKEYFKGVPSRPKNKNSAWGLASWSLGIVICIVALFMILRPPLFILFGLIGTLLLPPVQTFLEQNLKFDLTTKIKTITCLGLFVISLPLIGYYSNIEATENARLEKIYNQEQKALLLAQKKDEQRKDSIAIYVDSAKVLSAHHDNDDALEKLSFASSLTSNQAEKDNLKNLENTILASKIEDQIKDGGYKEAIRDIETLLKYTPDSPELLYKKAFCFSKTGNKKGAVYNLKKAIELGSTEAETLHEKINPIRKRISGYITRCCDGTTSSARGQGACSHHGGVCDWNEPIYQEYRKY